MEEPLRVPKSVVVGAQTYQIIERPESQDGMLGEAYAYTLVESNLIVMRQNLPLERKRSILIHEILHAVIFTYGRSDRVEKNESFDDWEHHFVVLVQEPMLLLLRQNPELVEFLTYDS